MAYISNKDNTDWNILHENALKRFSITSEKDGTWLICLKKRSDKGYDAPMRVCATLNEAVDYALYFDHAWDRV